MAAYEHVSERLYLKSLSLVILIKRQDEHTPHETQEPEHEFDKDTRVHLVSLICRRGNSIVISTID